MAFSRFVLTLIMYEIIKIDGYSYDTCDYDCNFDTKYKPCKSMDISDDKCVDYYDINTKLCPNGYYDCSPMEDPCNKECSMDTLGLPCIQVSIGNNMCYEYIEGYGCPLGTKDCYGHEKSCQYCSLKAPCISNKYTAGDYACSEKIYWDGEYRCPAGTTACNIDYDVCSKVCSKDTMGKPCMDDYEMDNMCWDYMDNGKCPYETTDCSGNNIGQPKSQPKPQPPKAPTKIGVSKEERVELVPENDIFISQIVDAPAPFPFEADDRFYRKILGFNDIEYENERLLAIDWFKEAINVDFKKAILQDDGLSYVIDGAVLIPVWLIYNPRYTVIDSSFKDLKRTEVKQGFWLARIIDASKFKNSNLRNGDGYAFGYFAYENGVNIRCRNTVPNEPEGNTPLLLECEYIDKTGNVFSGVGAGLLFGNDDRFVSVRLIITLDKQGPMKYKPELPKDERAYNGYEPYIPKDNGYSKHDGYTKADGYKPVKPKDDGYTEDNGYKPVKDRETYDGYKPIKSKKIDPCQKKCSDLTKGKPCIHNTDGDTTCFDFMIPGICPPGTTKCNPYDIPIPPHKPKKYSPKPQLKSKQKSSHVCDKKCSKLTKGKPCMHNNNNDNTCFSYMIHNICPAGTTKCVN